MNARKTPATRQKGTATVEFALAISLILTPLLLGVVDFGRYLEVSHAVSRAAHEGVFEAARGRDPVQIVQSHLTSAGLDPAKASVNVTPALGAGVRGESMQITVSYNLSGYALATWGGLFPQSLSSRATARHE